MTEVTLEIKGLLELQRANEMVVKDIADTGNLVAKAAYVIERQAKMNWGHGKHAGGFPNVRTGRLRASITTEIVSPTQARVGTNVEYAAPVEFGHEIHPRYTKSGASLSESAARSRMVAKFAPAYPFLGPTIEQTKDQITGVMVAYGETLGAEWGK